MNRRILTLTCIAAAVVLLGCGDDPDKEAAPTVPKLTLLSKTMLDANSPLLYASYLRPDGSEMVKIGGHSKDNGRTWESFAPTPDFDGGLPHGYRRESFPIFPDPVTGDILRVVPSLDTPGLDPNIIEPPIALETYYMRYRVSTDAGRTYLFDEPIIAEGFTEENPFEGMYKGKNGLFMGDVGSQIIRTQAGRILIPAQVCTLGEDGKLFSPGGGFTYTDVLIIIGEWQADHRLKWQTAERIVADPALSTRGVIEPTLAETKDGRILCVMRGSNGGSKDPECKIPSHKWRSISTDGGFHWSKPEPWAYDDGTAFFSPSAMSQLLVHSSGRVFWIGNISPANCKGNHPRHPLVIGEVDPGSLLLRKDSVLELDQVQPEEGDVNLSHWWGLEDRETGNIIVVGHRHNIGYTDAKPVQYTVAVK